MPVADARKVLDATFERCSADLRNRCNGIVDELETIAALRADSEEEEQLAAGFRERCGKRGESRESH